MSWSLRQICKEAREACKPGSPIWIGTEARPRRGEGQNDVFRLTVARFSMAVTLLLLKLEPV